LKITSGMPLSMQVTVMPSITSRTLPVGSSPGATEPAVSRKLILIGAEVPGAPSIRGLALIFDPAVRCLHGDVALHVGIQGQHAQRGSVALRFYQAGLERERHHRGQHVAAIGGGVDGVLVRLQLRKQEIEIDAGPGPPGNDADLAGERVRAAKPVDLALVGEPITASSTLSRVGRSAGRSAALKNGPREVPPRMNRQGIAVCMALDPGDWRFPL
jgi:hypothetical protein